MICVCRRLVCQDMYASVSQVASFWWTKGGPVNCRGGAVANGEATAAATASGPASSNIHVVRGQLLLTYYYHHKCMIHFLHTTQLYRINYICLTKPNCPAIKIF